MWSRKVQFGLAVLAITCAMLVTRFNEVDVPLIRILRGKNAVDPRELHLHGEFVESNLGSAQEPNGTITVRLIAEQFLFVPHCILVPAGVPVHLRITSADVEHKFSVDGLDYQAEATPGVVTEDVLNFPKPGDYAVPCREFCGAGHYAMRSEVRAVPREDFRNLRPDERVTCGPR
jgi:cytochrome c oxidase subunit 2